MHTPSISRRQLTQWSAAAVLASQWPFAFAQQAQEKANGSPRKFVSLFDGSKVPALGMGSWHLAAGRRPLGEEEAALQLGLSLGMQLIDTAEVYSNGKSEQLVGKVIAGRRQDVFLVSKIAPHNATSAQSIRRSCERSLRNLNTGFMDLYLLHWPAGMQDFKTVVDTFEALKAEGKIGHWGVSNFNQDDLQRLYAAENGKYCAANQVRYSLSDRSIETLGLTEWSAKNRVPLMAYSPLGSGDGDLLKNPQLAAVAQKHQSTPAAIAIAWTLRNGLTISIPESGNVAHVRGNASAAAIALDSEDLGLLEQAFPPRYIRHWSGA